jgi:hypothetical protein
LLAHDEATEFFPSVVVKPLTFCLGHERLVAPLVDFLFIHNYIWDWKGYVGGVLWFVLAFSFGVRADGLGLFGDLVLIWFIG